MHVVVQNVSQYSRLRIKLQIWLDDRAIAVRLPAGAGYVTPLRCPQGLRCVPSQLCSGYRKLFAGVKPTGCDFYHLRQPIAGVMNEQGCNSTPCTLMSYTGTNLPLNYGVNKMLRGFIYHCSTIIHHHLRRQEICGV